MYLLDSRQLIDLDDSAMRMSIEYARHMLVIDEYAYSSYSNLC